MIKRPFVSRAMSARSVMQSVNRARISQASNAAIVEEEIAAAVSGMGSELGDRLDEIERRVRNLEPVE